MLCVGRFAICGDWEDAPTPDGLTRLIMTPSLAHSNGWSPWTRAALAAVEETLKPGMRVADIGTGTGMVAIAAVLLGARHVTALDVHPEALAAASRNVQANDMTRQITVLEGSDPPADVDLIVVSVGTAYAERRRGTWPAAVVVVVKDDGTWEVAQS